ncbi:MAG: hypothetical protein KDC05_07000 [Bacteroidales bacterium]|nr:hypothetical protein [Bacteroidales bacterium]
MSKVYSIVLVLMIGLFIGTTSFAQSFSYTDNWGTHGLSLVQEKGNEVILNHSLTQFNFEDVNVKGETLKSVKTLGTFLPNDEGAPDLPGVSRYIAIPQGATASVSILNMRKEKFENVEIAPAPRIPLDTESGPLFYKKDSEIYSKDQFYPENPVIVSSPTKIRGVDVVMVGVIPFQYNPVTKEMIIYKDIEFSIDIIGGNGQIGDDRLRSRWWDPIVYDAVINPQAIPHIDYSKKISNSDTPDYEYVIITLNDPTFLAWADTIQRWRTLQGIKTGIVTTTDLGGNTETAIKTYVDNAYNTWDIPPAAVLLLGDYSTGTTGITSHLYDHPAGYPDYASDNYFADVTGDNLPDVVFARITANNASQLQVMITKFLNNERNPVTDPNFYDHPITALGWQTERWFQICSEVVGGFWRNEQGKNPVRINAVYSGSPTSDPWSTATNTSAVTGYFGPSGLGYITSTPQEIGGFSGGTATGVVNAINSGSFMLQHRDHGMYTGWGEPSFTSTNISSLTNVNNKLPFIFSINCQTGAFHNSSECFTEKFHRWTYGGQNSGALGLIAATEVSYSFVNDCYVWGLFDNMWPDFMPSYGTTPPSRDVLPAFGNAAGKYFLYSTSWPYNTSDKLVTYRLFHHHGDAFMTVYSEVPQLLTVNHAPSVLGGSSSFSVTADAGSFIALTCNGEILATADGTGSPVNMAITPQSPGNDVYVTVTKQNYYRYSVAVPVLPPSGPYLGFDSFTINDQAGNNNGAADFGEDLLLNVSLINSGSDPAYNVSATLVCSDPYISITDNSATFGVINAGSVVSVNNAYGITVADDIPDQHSVSFELQISGVADEAWTSYFSMTVNAPFIENGELTIADGIGGNGNGRLDPGETVNLLIEVFNNGNSDSQDVLANLYTANPYVTINSGTQNPGSIAPGNSADAIFSVTVDAGAPVGTTVNFSFDATAGNYSDADTYNEVIGQIPVLIVNMDPSNNSVPAMETAMISLGVSYDLVTSIPADMNLYSSVFVCLGIYSNNHILSTAESTLLVDYLNNGGQLYMEGGDTWYYDSQTAVHGMFNINATGDGTSDMATVQGQAGTITAGMSFSYSGENNYMDHIDPISPAFSILKNSSPVYGTAVAYDAGTYKTIGASHEFGGLDDGTFPSTKEELMNQYLTFFGITGTPLLPPDISVNPMSFNVTLNPDETLVESMTVTNNGEQELNFNISVSGSDATKGKMVQQLSKDELEKLKSKENISNAFDELTTGGDNPLNWALPPIEKYGPSDNKGEETFGSWAGGSWAGDARDRGNVFYVTTTTSLTEIRFYLDFTTTTDLYFFVYEGTTIDGTYSQIHETYVASSGTGEGWYSSGSIAVSLDAGYYYYIGSSWNGTATYGRGSETVPLTTSFGTLESGVAATTAGYPPATTCINNYTNYSPYYQTLVTSDEPVYDWLVPNPVIGSVPSFGSENIDVLFDATGMEEGIYYKDMTITSNDPDQPSVVVPCTLNVMVNTGINLSAKAFLEGPFSGTQMIQYLNALNVIPLNQPYNAAPWNYSGTESVAAIPNTSVIDWVLVELRETAGGPETATPATIIEQQAAFILTNGSIVSTDGVSPLSFTNTVTDDLYVVIWHRNHLGVMAAYPAVLNGDIYEYDFTLSASQVFGGSCTYKQVGTGIWGMMAGDANGDMEINNLDKNEKWYDQYNQIGYYNGDIDMNGQVDNVDKNGGWKDNAGNCSFIVK